MKALACPRCESNQTRKIGESPVKGKFEIYCCEACDFVWRSIEDFTDIPKGAEYMEHLRRNMTVLFR